MNKKGLLAAAGAVCLGKKKDNGEAQESDACCEEECAESEEV